MRNATEVNDATALNYVEITDISKKNSGYDVTFQDSISGKINKLEVKKIIAATGTHKLPGHYKTHHLQ